MAIASRTPTPHVADAFMKKLGKPFSGKANNAGIHAATGFDWDC